MRLGIDFDNTLVQYDHLFHRAAIVKQLIPESLPPYKTQVRDFIRHQHGPDVWTELQGYVYGKLIEEAQSSSGALEGLDNCKHAGVSILLISHKTEWPVVGPKWNLHDAARDWLRLNGFYDENSSSNLLDEIWFERTRKAKLDRITKQHCDVFVDDLPDILMDKIFPGNTFPIVFDPNNDHSSQGLLQLRSWCELPTLLKAMELI